MKFSQEAYSPALISEMTPLWQAHHDEVAAFKDIPSDPDLELYRKSHENKLLRIYTARQGPRLVGYQVFFVMLHPHSQHSAQAVLDIMYLRKEERRGLNGYRFIKFCDQALADEQVQAIFYHINARHDFGRLLERMGYELVDMVYARRVR